MANERSSIRDFRDLEVRQNAMDLCEQVHRLTWTFPRWKSGALASQLQGSTLSVPSNIAEGKLRASRKDYAHFVTMARSSLAEARTQLILAGRLGFITEVQTAVLNETTERLAHRLNALRRSLLADSGRKLGEADLTYDASDFSLLDPEEIDINSFFDTQYLTPDTEMQDIDA